MITLNNYIEKTYTGEVKLGEIPEGENYILYLENGDIAPLILLQEFTNLAPQNKDTNEVNLFVPNFPKNKFLLDKMGADLYNEAEINLIVFDNIKDDKGLYKNLFPNFSPYISKESAILFLNEEDKERYENLYKNIKLNYRTLQRARDNEYIHFPNKYDMIGLKDDDNIEEEYEEFITDNLHQRYNYKLKKLTIITNSIHSENIKQINETCKELKEKYGAEYIELVATYCYLAFDIQRFRMDGKDGECMAKFFDGEWAEILKDNKSTGNMAFIYDSLRTKDILNMYFNKLITTNSTRILKPQKSDNLEVINCEELIKII